MSLLNDIRTFSELLALIVKELFGSRDKTKAVH